MRAAWLFLPSSRPFRCNRQVPRHTSMADLSAPLSRFSKFPVTHRRNPTLALVQRGTGHRKIQIKQTFYINKEDTQCRLAGNDLRNRMLGRMAVMMQRASASPALVGPRVTSMHVFRAM